MTKARDTYHHGDLRASLIEAGEAVLAQTGVSGFSLRQVARKVGVSHSAPAHHFGDANGLLMAMAADGFRRFLGAMRDRQAAAGDDPQEMLVASGLGYLDFARSAPALFRLMFGERMQTPTPELEAAGDAAFAHLVADIARLHGVSPFEDEAAMVHVMAAWSMAHGFADLIVSGKMKAAQARSPEGQDAVFREAFTSLLTSPPR